MPYLGALRPGEVVNPNGYVVRKGNRTVYPTFDRSVLVRMTTKSGTVGWGETYGIVAPGAVAALINDLLAGFVVGRNASDPSAIYDDLYDMMRVRGYTGGFMSMRWQPSISRCGTLPDRKLANRCVTCSVAAWTCFRLCFGPARKNARGARRPGEILAGPWFQRLQVRNAGRRRWSGGRDGKPAEGAWTRCKDCRGHALEPDAGTGAGTDRGDGAL